MDLIVELQDLEAALHHIPEVQRITTNKPITTERNLRRVDNSSSYNTLLTKSMREAKALEVQIANDKAKSTRQVFPVVISVLIEVCVELENS